MKETNIKRQKEKDLEGAIFGYFRCITGGEGTDHDGERQRGREKVHTLA